MVWTHQLRARIDQGRAAALGGEHQNGLAQHRRRVILVGANDETARMEAEVKAKSAEEVDILARVDLSRTPVQYLWSSCMSIPSTG